SVLRGVVALGLFGVFGAGVYVTFRPASTGEVLPGVTVDGAIPEGDLRAFVAERARLLLDRKVTLVASEKGRERVVAESTLGALGVVVDEERAAERARSVGASQGLFTRRETMERAARGEIDVPLLPTVNAQRAMSVLDEV